MKTEVRNMIDVLSKVDEGASLKSTINRVLDSRRIDYTSRQRIFAFCYEIVRRRNLIDLAIQSLLPNTSLKKLDPIKRNLARVIVYIRFFAPAFKESIPIMLAEFKFSGDPFFKNLMDLDLQIVLSKVASPEEAKAYKYFLPVFVIRELSEFFGPLKANHVFKALLAPPPTYFRVNTLRGDEETILEGLRQEGVVFSKDPIVPFVYMINNKKSKITLPNTFAFKEGKVLIQDRASAYVSYKLNPRVGEKILDMCAAPGSKTSFIAALSNNKSRIIALESNLERTKILQNRLIKLGVTNVDIVNTDASYSQDLLPKGKFDKVLLDPPCSGIGTFATRPDTKWRLDKRKISRYAELQRKLLKAGVKVLKPGGIMVYSTCTLSSEENHKNIAWLLKEYPEMALLPVSSPILGFLYPSFNDAVEVILPHLTKSEGFIITYLTKKG